MSNRGKFGARAIFEKVTLDPKNFLEIVWVSVLHGGLNFICAQIRPQCWCCGKCGRGILLADDKKCRVCHSPATFHRAVNREAYRATERHIALMESLITRPAIMMERL